MSNHSGSHMLNDVIALLRRERVLGRLGKSHSQLIVLEMIRRAEKDHDCNPDEILEGHGKALGLCYYCLAPAKGVVADICPKCRAEIGCSEEDLAGWWSRRSPWATREKPREGESFSPPGVRKSGATEEVRARLGMSRRGQRRRSSARKGRKAVAKRSRS